jgi:hypothetical protein
MGMSKGMKGVLGVGGVVLLVALVVAVQAWREMTAMGFLRTPVFEAGPVRLPELRHPAVLVFSKTNSFIHKEAIPAAKQLLQDLAVTNGWSIYTTDSGAVFTPEHLARFDVMVWNNVTGDVLLPEQRAAMQAWLEGGGGFVGLHAAGDNSHDVWPWYQDSVIRARFIGHPTNPQFQQARLRIEPPADPLMAGLPDPWMRTDEWYSFAASPRGPGVRVLATLDEASYAPGSFFGKPLAMGLDHPVIWTHEPGKGRVFYSALGHTAASYAEPEYRLLLARAIAWAGGFGASPDEAHNNNEETTP